ncbi:transposable element Tcb2 transposase [Trichonephila clavipes]|nr:transposable element Tcb2 transposase [Trichonephila clavipes]
MNGGWVISLREGGFSYRAIRARVQRNSSTVMLSRLLQFVDVCCTVDCGQGCPYTGSPSRQTIDGCVFNGLMSTDPGKLIGTKLSFQRNHASIWDHDGRIHVRRSLPKGVIEQRSGLTPEVMVWGAIFCHGRSNCYELKQDNARPHVAETVRDFCSAQHLQFLPWPAYSPELSPIEQVWDLVGQRFAHDPRPLASKDELFLRIQAIWNSLPQTFKIRLTPCHVV